MLVKVKPIMAVATGLLATQVWARDIPANVQAFYNRVKGAGACTGSDALKTGFFAEEGGPKNFAYCQKNFAGRGFYLKGSGSNLADMDIDCDGEQDGLDPRCDSSDDTQAETSFKDQVSRFGISDLRADIHPYVVLGNEGNYSPTFDPRSAGVQPLSLVAVVCNKKLIYGFWGDTNGDDGPPLIGEASLAMGTACFGNSVNGNNGHSENDVLYIAFSGSQAVLGSSANWQASSYSEFEASITALGDQLVASL